MSTKTDNGNIESKLVLRRHFLELYHAGSRPSVLDCCAGEQKIWKALRETYDVNYLGLDKKGISGTLKMDSVDYLRRGHGSLFDVVDIDTYGSPFRHLAAFVRYMKKPATVFLTFGAKGVGRVHGEALTALGIDYPLPVAIAIAVVEERLGDVIGGMVHPHVCEYAMESSPGESVCRPTRYVGLRIAPHDCA